MNFTKTTRNLLLLLVGLGLAVNGFAQSFLTNGLVGYYPFNGNANDESGYGNNGIVNGATLTTDRLGMPNQAYHFGPTTSCVEVPVDFNNSPEVTISAWTRFDAPDKGQCVFARVDWNTGIILSYEASGGFAFQIGGGSSIGFKTALYPALPTIGKWYLLTGTYDHEAVRMYIDGALVAAQPYTGPIAYGSSLKNIIGKTDFPGPSYQVNGAIDDVRIYNRALSGIEVQQLYQSGSQFQVPHAAMATARVVNGFVVGITITDPGYGYTNAPVVEITGGGGHGAKAVASLAKGMVTSITITEAGIGYTDTPEVLISSPPQMPHAAMATARVVNGFVVGITITDPGYGYTNAPVVEITGGGGHGAKAVASIANGIVTGITITDAGIGYTGTPDVVIASPPFAPWLTITVSQVRVSQHVVLGHKYVLESSRDLNTWTQVGDPFLAQSEVMDQVFEVDSTGRYFRLQEIP